jgi:hypothetical protein
LYRGTWWSIDESSHLKEAKIVQATSRQTIAPPSRPLLPLGSGARSSSRTARRGVPNLLSHPQAGVCPCNRIGRHSGETINNLRDKVYRKAYRMYKSASNQEGVAMSGEVGGETALAEFRSSVEARADIAGSPREDQAPPFGSLKRDGVATTHTNPSIVAAEQYLCLLLGLICMACGGWGVCMKYSLDLSSGYIPWLGSAYGPTLRLTAGACVVLGVVLVRLGFARPGLSSVSGAPKLRDLSEGTMCAVQREHPAEGRV